VHRHVDVQHTAPVEREYEKDVEDMERDRGHGQKVDRDRSLEMVAEESLLRLRRGTARSPSWLRHVLRDRVLVDGMSEPNRTLNRWRGQGFSRREFSFFRFGVSWVLRIQWTFPFSALEGAGAR
jgi:hypothetical protein